MTSINASLFTQPNLQLRIWFNDGVNGFAALSPVQNLTPAPYAIHAINADNLASVAQYNTISPGEYATVGGGYGNTASGGQATVGGGYDNTAGSGDSTVGGGYNNITGGGEATVSGGANNGASGSGATVGGGDNNLAAGNDSTVGGGANNIASGNDSTVGGGANNTCNGFAATVCGGANNNAAGNYSFAAGNGAQALSQGSFVWADDNGGTFASTGQNQFDVRAAGGVLLNATAGITLAGDVAITGGAAYHHLSLSGGNSTGYLYGSYPALGDGIHLGYNYYYDAGGAGHIIATGGGTSRISLGYGDIVMAVGGVNTAPSTVMLHVTTSGVCVNGTVSNCSDRNVKQDFTPVSPSQILDKVLQLPVCEWSYKIDSATRHIGPMAQDFYAGFNVGTDDKHIAPIDESGVAFAAIQGLNQKLNEKAARIEELEKKLDELQAVVKQLAAQK
jgi:hypothetical protein